MRTIKRHTRPKAPGRPPESQHQRDRKQHRHVRPVEALRVTANEPENREPRDRDGRQERLVPNGLSRLVNALQTFLQETRIAFVEEDAPDQRGDEECRHKHSASGPAERASAQKAGSATKDESLRERPDGLSKHAALLVFSSFALKISRVGFDDQSATRARPARFNSPSRSPTARLIAMIMMMMMMVVMRTPGARCRG